MFWMGFGVSQDSMVMYMVSMYRWHHWPHLACLPLVLSRRTTRLNVIQLNGRQARNSDHAANQSSNDRLCDVSGILVSANRHSPLVVTSLVRWFGQSAVAVGCDVIGYWVSGLPVYYSLPLTNHGPVRCVTWL